VVDVAAIFGLSGVGKGWLISRYVSSHAALHIQASQLLREAISGGVVTPEELRTGAVLDNQGALIVAFATTRASAVIPIIFDGHCLVDSGSQLIESPTEVIEALSFSGLVFVRGDPQEIVARRRSDITRTRPQRSAEEISLHQLRAGSLCEEYAKRLKLDLHTVDAGDEGCFAGAIASILQR
jgi:adenylate kinase